MARDSKKKVSFVLDELIENWGESRILKFKKTICEIAGAEMSSIERFRIREGCVIVVFDLDRASAERLISLITRFKGADRNLDSHDNKILADFVKDFRVLSAQLGPSLIEGNTPAIKDRVSSDLILLVHGWRGDAQSFGRLPEFLEKNTGCECKQFIYPTGFLDTSSPIHYVAKAFDNWIRNETESGERKFAIVAHSMGGIVSRAALSGQHLSLRPLDKSVRQITFVASPLGGAWLAKLAKKGPGSALAQVAELAPNSIFLEQVKMTWSSWVKNQEHLVGNVRAIYSPNDEVVDTVSAIGEDPEAIPILGSKHSDIIKPSASSDEIVRTISRLIRESDLNTVDPVH